VVPFADVVHTLAGFVRYLHMTTTRSISNPAAWHRRICHINNWLAVSGDLDTAHPEVAKAQLQRWIAEGITDIIDLRGEWSDAEFVAAHVPEINYHYLGTHDDGGWQEDEWFEAGRSVVKLVKELGGKALVHCHMGVNRAPSMAYSMLLDDGYDHIEALEVIRDARPIAGIIYAPAAISHHLRANGVDGLTSTERKVQVRNWLSDNPVDLYWVISRIREAE
jgi:dual specificity phosphatase 3